MIALIFALGLSAQTASSPAARDPLYVLGDVVRVRAAPSESAAVTARLRNGSPVHFLEERGAWLKVNAAPDDKEPFVGWVQSSLVGADWVGTNAMVARADKATGNERVLWLERAVARGEDRSLLPKLRDAYRAVGDSKRATMIEHRIDGTAPFYVGACVGGETQLLAILEGKEMRALAGHVTDGMDDDERNSKARNTPLVKELEVLRVAMTGTAELWHGGASVSRPVFQRPRVDIWNSVGGATAVLVVGKCPAHNENYGVGYASIISSAPLFMAELAPALDGAMATRLLADGAASELHAVVVAGRFVDTTSSSHGRQLFTKGGAQIARDVTDLPAMGGSWWTLPSGTSLLLSSSRADEVPGYGWTPYSGMGEVAFYLVIVDDKLGVTHVPVQVYESGC